MLDLIKTSQIKPGYRTDHSLIELSFFINKFEKGKGRWMFNTELLKDREYLTLINNLIEEQRFFYAVPLYNIDCFNLLDQNEIQYTIDDDLLLEVIY